MPRKRQRQGDVPATRARPPVHVAVDGLTTALSRPEARRVVEGVLRAERVPKAMLSVAFITNRQIAALNREHLGTAGATDVISFGFATASNTDPVIGDVYIAPQVARANARLRGVTVREEIVRLLVHGTLHVLGHDHPEGDGRERSAMWKRQEQLVRRSMTRAESD